MGVICWYADDIFHANANVGMAAYCTRWYQTERRCRRALLFIIISLVNTLNVTSHMTKRNMLMAFLSNEDRNKEARRKTGITHMFYSVTKYDNGQSTLHTESVILENNDFRVSITYWNHGIVAPKARSRWRS
ncbi:hypothetical protein EVAR_5957_1 [Eumeta japonica]|uniref:Uncharacterized protein n=1 Tax=Eumeta variegata TaxID=151549 RepID=A0A4C1TFR4_EUMVA|nr:hypothetical protein EVAR_5957_1 [Eumeta japonica]